MRFAAFLSCLLLPVASPDPARAVSAAAVDAGNFHTCAVSMDGMLACWGANTSGQLGDGTTTPRNVPTPVVDGAVSVVVGGDHTCALSSGGVATCWGDNGYGQLGDGTITSSPLPVPVSGITSEVVQLAAGSQHACALAVDDSIWCWGANWGGQLGDGTTMDRSTPVAVIGLPAGATTIAAGAGHSCALYAAGAVWCWGANGVSQLGDGTTTSSPTPVLVGGLPGPALGISLGDVHSCARILGGSLFCWGGNGEGALGDGTTTSSPVPVAPAGLPGAVTAVDAARNHTCAVVGGGVFCWGDNEYGQLGDGSTSDSLVPVAATGAGSGYAGIATGLRHTCALRSDGRIHCFGYNFFGQLGNGLAARQARPVAVSGLPAGVTSLSAGSSSACAAVGGGAYCWGNNAVGEVGDGTTIDRNVPVPVVGLSAGVVSVSAGTFHACALSSGGAAHCWGRNNTGQLGDGTTTDSLVPVAVSGLSSGGVTVAPGHLHTCAEDSDGMILCWGYNIFGQLGDGTNTASSVPVAVSDPTLDGGLGTGNHHVCAITTGAGARCWGRNDSGQLGDGTTNDANVPTPVSGLSNGVSAVDGGTYHSCALTSGGGVLCWGANQWGQLGDGSTSSAHEPVPVAGLASGVAAISVGNVHTCALTSGGSVLCWGYNGDGLLGDDTTVSSSVPRAVVGLSDVASVAAGGLFTCALTNAGVVYCWGRNDDGQVGNGFEVVVSLPTPVLGFDAPEIPVLPVGAYPLLALLLAGLAFLARPRAQRPQA